MKNIVGDVLQRPALAGARDRADGHQPAAARGERDRRQQADRRRSASRPRSRPITDQRAALDGADFVVVAFQIGGYEPATVTDFEVPKTIRPAPDDRRHARHRRHHARPPHRAASLEDLRGHAAGLPRRDHAAIRQPDGDQHLGDRREISDHPPGRPLPFGAGHGDGAGARSRHSRSSEIRYRAAGINHMAFYLKFEQRHAGRLLPRPLSRPAARPIARAAPRSRGWNPRCPNKVRYEMLTRLGYFVTESSEHFAEYTPWFIKRDRPGPDREVRHPARRISQALHRADRALEEARPRSTARPTRSRSKASRRICLRDHELGLDRRAVGDLRQRPQQRLHHLAARRLRGRGAVPGRPQRHPADPHRRTAAAARPR